MRRITPNLTAELFNHFGNPQKERVGAGEPFKVDTFSQLVQYVAKLSFNNKDHLLFYRGQMADFKNKANISSFYPSVYRGDYLSQKEVGERFAKLKEAGRILADEFENRKISGYKEVKRRKHIQWSILQHYEVCPTPYLDFTHSLRVACSFAMMNNDTSSACVSIFGLPYLTNRISINSEHDIINIRLLSICPPAALRPHFQEGYLVGTDNVTTTYDSKGELDFNNRLVAKFEIPNHESFWGDGFNGIPHAFLYPDNDPVLYLCEEIKKRIG